MKRIVCAVMLTIFVAGSTDSQQVRDQAPLIVARRPTIVAFFVPTTETETNSGEGDAEALGDFNYYAYLVKKRLDKADIEFHEVSGRSFKVRDRAKTRVFQIGKIGVGYYFIAPGREPHVEYGVLTDEDLMDAAQKYFGISVPKEDCKNPHRSR